MAVRTCVHTIKLLCLTGCLWGMFSCQKQASTSTGGWSAAPADTSLTAYDLAEIQQSGELIVGTLYGPQSYYEQRGRKAGLQYLLIENFALQQGLKVRVETAADTAKLLHLLCSGGVDVVAYALPQGLLKEKGLVPCGYAIPDTAKANDAGTIAWSVRSQSADLAAELDRWYDTDLVQQVSRAKGTRNGSSFRHRHIYAPYRSRSKGIISSYDSYFKQYSRLVGWDWRLLAAQCYQESGFDPHAVSWAGAQGLMQIMPGTARHLGLSESQLFNAQMNIEAGARYLRQLDRQFADIRSRHDRICFTLAAYNGGYHHIRDAMSLARKYGHNATRWTEVAPYVLHLSEARYYRDPVVKYGYMIGSETYNYVHAVMGRWGKYKTGASVAPLTDSYMTPLRSTRRNRFSRNQKILLPTDSAFLQ